MTKKKPPAKWIDPNLIIAVGVLLISFSTLFVYVRQAKIMSEQTKILLDQTKANAWPHLSLELFRSYDASGLTDYRIEITNKGTGPAILEHTIVSYDGTPVVSWQEFYDAIAVPDSIPRAHNNNNINDRVLTSDEKLNLINWSISSPKINNAALLNYINKKADKIEIEICYKSIHGDFWSVKRKGFRSDLEINERSVENSCTTGDKNAFLE